MSSVRTAPREKLSTRVASVLRSRLIAGDIPPGQKLPTEMQLTEQFGVSRTVVREAIATLAADGMVESRQGAGVFVVNHPASTLSKLGADIGSRVSTAINVLEVRLAIEVESAALAAARRNLSQLAMIEEAFSEFERNLIVGGPTGPADFAFHRAIAAATNNPFYVEMLDALGQRAIPCDASSPWTTELAQNEFYQRGLHREHAAILEAIGAQDAEAARAAMRHHLSRSQARYQERLYERAAFFSIANRGVVGN